MFTHTSFNQCNQQHSPHTFPICVIDKLQLCIHPCSYDVQWLWQQCWHHLPIQIIYPKDILSHVLATIHHTGQDLESREDVPTHPTPNIAPDFTHRSGEEVLHCPGTIWYHAQAVLVVYGEEPPDILQKCAVILVIDYHKSWHGMVKHKAISAEEHDMHDFQAPWLHCAIFFLLDIWALLSAILHFSRGSNECIHASSSIKMWCWNISPSFL